MNRAILFLALVVVLPAAAFASERGLLWRVVQTCVASHNLIGTSFPCLAVDTKDGDERGYAVIRAPFEGTHVVVTPTVRTVGIEADRLRAADAPNYFSKAWAARHFATDQLPRQPARSDLALAVNSRPGRSQDQLHIHIDCIRQDVKRSIVSQQRELRPGVWTRVGVLTKTPRYFATVIEDPELADTNIFRLVQAGLDVDATGMDQVTIVVIGAELQGRPGFIVLARQRLSNTRDEAHGEALMDHSCSAFQ